MQQYDPDIFRKNTELKQQLDRAEAEIKMLLNKNNELIERCEFLQKNFNGDYNELLIEYQALSRMFDLKCKQLHSPIMFPKNNIKNNN